LSDICAVSDTRGREFVCHCGGAGFGTCVSADGRKGLKIQRQQSQGTLEVVTAISMTTASRDWSFVFDKSVGAEDVGGAVLPLGGFRDGYRALEPPFKVAQGVVASAHFRGSHSICSSRRS
jgi:hypothetical protein